MYVTDCINVSHEISFAFIIANLVRETCLVFSILSELDLTLTNSNLMPEHLFSLVKWRLLRACYVFDVMMVKVCGNCIKTIMAGEEPSIVECSLRELAHAK